jgi:hypothetical protein
VSFQAFGERFASSAPRRKTLHCEQPRLHSRQPSNRSRPAADGARERMAEEVLPSTRKTCTKRDCDRPEMSARVFKEKSSEIPSFSRKRLSTRLTPGWILTGRRRCSSSVLTQRSTRASVGILPRATRQRATWFSEMQAMPPSMPSLRAAPNSLSESTKPIRTVVSRASTS